MCLTNWLNQKFIIAILAGSLLIPEIAFSNDYLDKLKRQKYLHAQHYLYFNDNREKIFADLSSDNLQNASLAVLNIIIAWELSDGAESYGAGLDLIQAWNKQPHLTSSWFNNKETSLDNWIDSQIYMFINMIDDYGLEESRKKKLELIRTLKPIEKHSPRAVKRYIEFLENNNQLKELLEAKSEM